VFQWPDTGHWAGENSNQPGGLRAGSPPSPPPHLIRSSVRRLLRSPRFRVRVPIVERRTVAELLGFDPPRFRRGRRLNEARHDLAKLAENFTVVLVEVAGETVILQ